MPPNNKQNALQIALYSVISVILMSVIIPVVLNLSSDYLQNRADVVALTAKYHADQAAAEAARKAAAKEASEFRRGVLDQLKLTNENLTLVNKNIADTTAQNVAYMLDCMNKVHKVEQAVISNARDIAACQKVGP